MRGLGTVLNVVAILVGAGLGVLIKNAEALERFARITSLFNAFEKLQGERVDTLAVGNACVVKTPPRSVTISARSARS